MAENKTLEHLPEVRAAVAALSPEDREVLAAVQVSPFKLTAPEQFKEFAANIDYFVFEPNIHDLNDLGWRYLAQHMDTPLPTELLKAIDPVPFGKYAMQEEQGHFASLLVIGKTSFRSSIIQDARSYAQRLLEKIIQVHAAAVVPVPLERPAAHPHFA